MISSEALREAVRKVILDFEATHSNETTQTIADKSLSSYTTILEIRMGTLKSLSIKKALEISNRLNGPQTLEGLLKTTANDCQEYSFLSNYDIYSNEIDSLFAHKDYQKLLWAAFGNGHITRSEIKDRGGSEGEERLDHLLDKGVVSEKNGVVKGVSESARGGALTALSALKNAIDYWRLENHKRKENLAGIRTNNVNDKFISMFRKELIKLFKVFEEKSQEKDYIGDKRVFFGQIFDRYMDDKTQQEEYLQ